MESGTTWLTLAQAVSGVSLGKSSYDDASNTMTVPVTISKGKYPHVVNLVAPAEHDHVRTLSAQLRDRTVRAIAHHADLARMA